MPCSGSSKTRGFTSNLTGNSASFQMRALLGLRPKTSSAPTQRFTPVRYHTKTSPGAIFPECFAKRGLNPLTADPAFRNSSHVVPVKQSSQEVIGKILALAAHAKCQVNFLLPICFPGPRPAVGLGERTLLVQIALDHEHQGVLDHAPSVAQILALAVDAGKIEKPDHLPAIVLAVIRRVILEHRVIPLPHERLHLRRVQTPAAAATSPGFPTGIRRAHGMSSRPA